MRCSNWKYIRVCLCEEAPPRSALHGEVALLITDVAIGPCLCCNTVRALLLFSPQGWAVEPPVSCHSSFDCTTEQLKFHFLMGPVVSHFNPCYTPVLLERTCWIGHSSSIACKVHFLCHNWHYAAFRARLYKWLLKIIQSRSVPYHIVHDILVQLVPMIRICHPVILTI